MKDHKSEASPLNTYALKINVKKRCRERMLEKYRLGARVLA